MRELGDAYVRGAAIRRVEGAPAEESPPPVSVESADTAGHGIELTKRMLFGGPNHRTYLGCVNCSAYAADSILNAYGNHGSKYATDSVLNPYGDFGSRYSNYSMCNPYASDPPVIVDGAGNFYGRLTANPYHRQATNDAVLRGWVTATCEAR